MRKGEFLLPTYPQGVGDAIDVVEPRSDQRDLQDAAIVEAHGSQTVDVVLPNLGRVFRELHDVIQHYPILWGDWRSHVVFFKGLD